MAESAPAYQTRYDGVIRDIAKDIARGIPIIDAVIMYGENNGMTPEEMGMIVKRDPMLLQRITEEAVSFNMLKGVEKEQTLGEFFY